MLHKQLQEQCQSIVESLGYDLVALEYKPGKKGLLRVFIDKKGGVDIDDCVKVSHILGDSLDVQDLIQEAYNFEVSSPGLDRPLKTIRDFWRKEGKQCQVSWNAENTTHTATGEILSAQDNMIIIKTDHDHIEINIDAITKANLVI